MTNREWLNSLTDEELAEFEEKVTEAIFAGRGCINCWYHINKGCMTSECIEGRIKWLQAEHKDD